MASSVRAAVVGVTGPAEDMLAGLLKVRGLSVVGVADSDKERLEGFGETSGLATYDDHRVMLVETRPEIAFVNVPRYQEAEVLSLAVELGVGVWKPYPLARSFGEAVGFVRSFEKGKLGLYVGNPLRYGPVFEQVSEWLSRLGGVHLIENEYMRPAALGGEITGWRASKAQAGGGVLLEGAYPGLAVIASQFGLPEQVYCLTSTGLGMQTDRPYETEDMGLLTMTFRDGAVGCSVALRTAAERGGKVVWHGSEGKLTLAEGSVRFVEAGGEGEEVRHVRENPTKPFRAQAGELVRVVRGEQVASSVGRDHLAVMAVIEAAYLSSRTGQSESPSHFYELHDLTPPAAPVITSPAG